MRVELVDRQHVRAALAEVERNEHVAAILAMRELGAELDDAAPRLDADEVAVSDAELGGVVRVDPDVRLGREGVERVPSAGSSSPCASARAAGRC